MPAMTVCALMVGLAWEAARGGKFPSKSDPIWDACERLWEAPGDET
jgi:hypothetical protein